LEASRRVGVVELILSDRGDCRAEVPSVKLDAIVGRLDGGTTEVLPVVGIDTGVLSVPVVVVTDVDPKDGIAVVELAPEPVVK
jgi:hypothetical protein